MADSTQPIYQWRPTGTQQQGSNYFGAAPSFGQALNSGVAAAGGASSPFQAPSGGFAVPGGPAQAGFNSPNFAGASGPAAAPNDGAKPASFGDALRQNPLAQSFQTSPQDAATQAALRSAVGNLQPNQGPSMSSMFALNEENKGEAEALRKAQESSALNGRAFTGQIVGDTADTLAQKIIPQRQNFLGQLQGQEEQQQIAKQQNAQKNILDLTNQAQQASQFGQTLALNTKLGLGDLSIREKTLAQNASQFTDQLAFQKYATDKGFTEQEAQRAWQATQNEAQIASAEKIAAGSNATTLAVSNLSSATQKYIADNGLALDAKKLDAQIAQFASNQDFQKWAVTAGIDAQAAHDMWQANQNDIQRKFDAGAQLTANEQQVRMEGLQEAHDTAMADLNHTLNLDTIDKQTASTAMLKTMDQNFTSLMTDKGYTHDEAMAATKQEYAKELEQMGYDHDTAMQASDQWFKGTQAQADRDQTKMLAEAQMAQTYDMFNQDMQQKYAFKDADVQIAKAQLDQHAQEFAQSMGLDQATFDYLKKTDAFNQLSGTVSTLMAMAGDNKDMQQFAAETFYKGMGNITGADGQPIMPKDQVAQGLLNIKASAFTDPAQFQSWAAGQKDASGQPVYTADQIQKAMGTISKASGTGTAGDVQNAQALVDQMLNDLPAKVNPDAVKQAIQKAASGAYTAGDLNDISDMPGAGANGLRTGTLGTGTQQAKDYYGFYDLTQMGVPAATAAKLISTTIGADRFNAAYKAMTGKDYA